MKKLLMIASALFLFQTATASSARADFSFNINVGGPPVVVNQAPEFIYPPQLGYGVAVGLPYDMFYVSDIYYLYRGGGWFRSPDGVSWVKMRHRELPPELRRYKIAQIRQYRDREYSQYSRDRAHYRGRHFRPGRPEGGEHREMRGPGREGGEHREMRGQGHEGGEHREMGGPGHEGRPEMGGPRHDEQMQRAPEGERGGERREHER